MEQERTTVIDGVKYKLVPVDEPEQVTSKERRTGYEQAKPNEGYWYSGCGGSTCYKRDFDSEYDSDIYYCGNAVTDEQLAYGRTIRNKLLWKLERFAAEKRKQPIDWDDYEAKKYYIYYEHSLGTVEVDACQVRQDSFQVYFDSKESAEEAIKMFYDELIWFFTQYRDTACC